MSRLEELGRRVVRMPGVWRLRVLQQLARLGVREETLLILMAAAVGFAAAWAAWAFEKVVWGLQHYYFAPLAQWADMTGKGLLLLAVLPALGGLAVSLVRWFFRHGDSKLHGLSAVLMSLIRERGRLKHTLGLETLLTSGLTIGTGGSAGPEAPIAIIGSSIGSIVAALAGISRSNTATLVGCGAAAGISAVFDAPIAGILFALEVLLRDFSVKTFMPIVISAVVSTTVFHGIRAAEASGPPAVAAAVVTGAEASAPQAAASAATETAPAGTVMRGIFEIPSHGSIIAFNLYEAPNFVVLGLICGGIAIGLTWLMEAVTHGFSRFKAVPRFFHPALGALISGLCGALLMILLRDSPFVRTPPGSASWYVPIFASGYPTVKQALDPSSYAAIGGALGGIAGAGMVLTIGVLALLCVMKVIATAFTIGGGGSGGVFAPALFMGATAGGAVGLALRHLGLGVQPSTYALVGMGAVLASLIQAPLMGIILLFELTRNYEVMLPIMLAAVTATLLYRLVMRESVYTLSLRKMGVRVGAAVGMAALRRVGVDQMALRRAPVARPEETLADIVKRSQASDATDFVVLDKKGRYLGLLTAEDVRVVMLAPESAPLLLVGEVMRSNVPPLRMGDSLEAAWDSFARNEVNQLVVMSHEAGGSGGGKLEGMLARGDVMRRYHDELGG